MSASTKKVGVIGAGSFGTAISNLIALNGVEVLLYSRQQKVIDRINKDRQHFGTTLSNHIELTSDIEQLARECTLIFPIVPSKVFRGVIKYLSLIHISEPTRPY